MKVVVLVLCAVAGTSASEAVAWPGALKISSPFSSPYSAPLSLPYSTLHASEVKTVIPSSINGFGYSSSQYLNAIPTQGYQPQFSYQISIPGYPSYQPVVPSYYPSNNFLYPSLSPSAPFAPFAPVAPAASPQPPAQNLPSSPTGAPAGDEDTAVIDSAEFLPNQQQSSAGASQPPTSQPQIPSTSFPSFPQPSLDTKNMPEFPQIPEIFQQFSQPGSSLLQFPQQPPSNIPAPEVPSSPSSPTVPASDNSDKGLNDEDTVTVEAA